MLRWLVLPMVVFAYLAATVSAAAPRDRDHDRLPDRWERSHHLSTTSPSAKRDPDGDRLKNRRELRLRTHPRRADTDRDRLRDGAEVRRFHTNPRKRDTDGDRFSDRCELRKGTNPRKRQSRPKRRCSKSRQRYVAPAPPSNFPDASNTGVPAGKTLTPSSGITVRQDGTVIDGVDAPWIEVQAANVTIRNSRVSGCDICILNRSTGLVVEDVTIEGADGTGIMFGNYTARRVDVSGTENGFNVGNNTTIIDSWIHDLDTSGDAHTDGIQSSAGGAGNVLIRHNNIDSVPTGASGCTSAVIMHTGGDPQNHDWRIEDNRLDGGGCSVALYCPRATASNIFVNNNRMLKGVFGGYTDSCRGTHVTEFAGNVDDGSGAPLRP